MKSLFRTFATLVLVLAAARALPARAESTVEVPALESAYGAPSSRGSIDDRWFFIQTGLNGPGADRLDPPLRVESASRFSKLAPELTLGFIRRRALSSAWEGRTSWGGSWTAFERSETGPSAGLSPHSQLLGVIALPLAGTLQWTGWRTLHPFTSLGLRPSMVLSPRSVIADRVSENHLDGSWSAGFSLALGSLIDSLGTTELQLDWTLRHDFLASASIDLSNGSFLATLALPWE